MVQLRRMCKLWMLFVMIGWLLSACGTSPTATPPPSLSSPVLPTPDPQMLTPSGSDPKAGLAACPRLDSLLVPLTQTNDPATVAASLQIPYEDGRVLVFVTADAGLDLTAYNAIQTARDDKLFQLLVPANELCNLAQDPTVQRVAPPMLAVPSSLNQPEPVSTERMMVHLSTVTSDLNIL